MLSNSTENIEKEKRTSRFLCVVNIIWAVVLGLFLTIITFIGLTVGLMSDVPMASFVIYFLPILIAPAFAILFIVSNIKIRRGNFRNWSRMVVIFQAVLMLSLGARMYPYLSHLSASAVTLILGSLFLLLTVYFLFVWYWFGFRNSIISLFVFDSMGIKVKRNFRWLAVILLVLPLIGHIAGATSMFREDASGSLKDELRKLLPVIPQTLNDCLGINDNQDLGRDKRSLCFQKFIVLQNNPQICDTLSAPAQDECYFHAAFSLRDVDLCEKINKQSTFGSASIPLYPQCQYNVALMTHDINICDNITLPKYKEACRVVATQGNGLATPNQKPFFCGMVVDPKDQSYCYLNLARKTNDFYFCSFIPRDDNNFQDTRDNCYSLVGTNTKDPLACKEIVSTKEADYCWHLISGPLNDYQFCEKIKDPGRNKDCKSESFYYNLMGR